MRKLLIWYADNGLWRGKAGRGPIFLFDMRLALVRMLKERGVEQALISRNFTPVLEQALDYFSLKEYFSAIVGEPDLKESELALGLLDKVAINGETLIQVRDSGRRYQSFFKEAAVVLPNEVERVRLRELAPGLAVAATVEVDGLVSKEFTPDSLKTRQGVRPSRF